MTGIYHELASDPAARAAIKTDPRAWLTRHGEAPPEGITIEVHESTPSELHVVLPENWRHATPTIGHPAVDDLLRQAASDEALRDRVLADPAKALRDVGVALPAGLEIRIHQNTTDAVHIALPPTAGNDELADSELELVAGGKSESVSGNLGL